MSDGAIRKLHEIQPFRFTELVRPHMSLGILNRLHNADKHRKLVVVANFLRPALVTIHWPDGPEHLEVAPTSRYRGGSHGAVVARLDRKVKVEASGALQVTIGGGEKAGPGGYGLPDAIETIRDGITGAIIPAFEPFVRT
ncbi:MAG: hypothetical protein LC808_01195 [Actinobacteria bacterium]|nr:hypothetical protein [Actinomycetota bacterium]